MLRTKPDTGTAHTPGPWHFGPMHGWIGMCVMRKPSSEYGPQGTIGDAPIAKVIDGAAHWENSYPVEANARLISAAPDMFEALRDVVTFAAFYKGKMEDTLGDEALAALGETALAAIAKAEGRS